MNAFTKNMTRLLAVVTIVMMSAVYLGCGSKEKAESTAEKTEKAATTTEAAQPQTTSETQTAPETEDWAAAYDNPKKGIDPVCGMTLEREYIEVATIGDKKYALCSVGCAEMLKADPDKYLKGDASTESPH